MVNVIFKPCYSTNNTYIQEIVNALEKNGANIINKNITRKTFKSFYNITKFLFSKKVKIIHYNWIENIARDKNLLNWLKIKILFIEVEILHFFKVKICWTMHNATPHDCKNNRDIDVFMKRWIKKMDMVMIHCQDSKNLLISKFGYNQDKILYVPHGAYMTGCINKGLRDKLVCKYHIDNRSIIFLYFGIISEYKNVPLLLEVFSKLKNNNIKLIVAGKMSMSINIDMQNKIRLQCSQLSNVILDERFVPEEEVSTIFSLCDIVILPYDKTSMQNSGAMIQAFSNGKPVIISEFGYVLDIKDKDFVFSYNYNNPESEKRELMAQINNAVSKKEQLKSLGVLAKEFADTELNWNMIGKKIVEAYKNIK